MSTNCALPSAVLHGLFHVAIKTSDLESTRVFWRDIIGLREVARPDFGYPGAWLGCPQPGGQAIIHIYAGGPALGASGVAPRGTGAIDHVSLSCSGYRDFVTRFENAGLPFREFIVPGTTLWQLGADQICAPKFCSGSNSGPRRPVGTAAAPASRARKRPEPGAARRNPSSTTTRPRLNTVTGQPMTVRPS